MEYAVKFSNPYFTEVSSENAKISNNANESDRNAASDLNLIKLTKIKSGGLRGLVKLVNVQGSGTDKVVTVVKVTLNGEIFEDENFSPVQKGESSAAGQTLGSAVEDALESGFVPFFLNKDDQLLSGLSTAKYAAYLSFFQKNNIRKTPNNTVRLFSDLDKITFYRRDCDKNGKITFSPVTDDDLAKKADELNKLVKKSEKPDGLKEAMGRLANDLKIDCVSFGYDSGAKGNIYQFANKEIEKEFNEAQADKMDELGVSKVGFGCIDENGEKHIIEIQPKKNASPLWQMIKILSGGVTAFGASEICRQLLSFCLSGMIVLPSLFASVAMVVVGSIGLWLYGCYIKPQC